MQRRVASVIEVLESKNSPVDWIKPSETVGTLSHRLAQGRIGVMVVSEDGEGVAGIVSERDVAYGLSRHTSELHRLPVEQLMTKKVITCRASDSVIDVAKIMRERRIRHLPVTENGKLIGVIGMRDIMMQRLEQMERTSKLVGGVVTAED
jgi:CBS domain-containing protein